MRSRWDFRFLCLASVSACIGEADVLEELAPPVETVPHRLAPFGIDAEGGATIEIGIHDRQLDLRCEPQPADDGTLRCAPRGAYAFQTGLFADEDCRTPAMSLSGESPAVGYATAWADVCRGIEHSTVYEFVGAPLEAAFRDVDGVCRRLESTRPSSFNGPPFFALKRVPNDRFEQMTRHEVPLADGLVRIEYRTAEGAAFTTLIEDQTNKLVCRPSELDGYTTCVPRYTGFGLYGDSTCGALSGVAFQWSSCIELTYAFAHTDLTSCWGPTLVRVDEPWTGGTPPTIRGFENECVASMTSAPYRATPVDPRAVLAPLQRVRRGTGRIEASHFATLDGTPLSQRFGTFFDAQEGTTCVVREIGGTLRCIPADAASAHDLSRDPACVEPITVVSERGRAPAPSVAYAAQGLEIPGEVSEVLRGRIDGLFEVGEELDARDLYQRIGDRCERISDTTLNACARFFAVGARIDPSRYAPMRRGELDGPSLR